MLLLCFRVRKKLLIVLFVYSKLPSLSSIFASSSSSTSILLFVYLIVFFCGFCTSFVCVVSLPTVGVFIGILGSFPLNFLFRTSNSSNTLFNSRVYCSFCSFRILYCSYLRSASISSLLLVSSSFLTSIGSLIPT